MVLSIGMRTKRAPLILTVAGLALLAWTSLTSPSPRVIYNASNSLPIGWYRMRPVNSLNVGTIVLVHLPAAASAVAAQRGYLPTGVPLLKRIGAVWPQVVCVHGGTVRIDNVPVGVALSVDGAGRDLSAWPQCRRLRPDEVFLLSATNPASFDSRYFGPVRISDVIGQAQPIRTWSRR
jgi:conjugative transfer signal peptidase TraF